MIANHDDIAEKLRRFVVRKVIVTIKDEDSVTIQ